MKGNLTMENERLELLTRVALWGIAIIGTVDIVILVIICNLLAGNI